MRGLVELAGTGALAAWVLAGAAGCGADAPIRAGTELPSHVRVSILDATTGVAKPDGEKWDGTGQVPEGLIGTVAGLLVRRNPYGAVLSYLTPLTMEAFEKPDPTGSAELWSGGVLVERLPLTTGGQEDTWNPQWKDAKGSAPSFARVPLNSSTRIRVQLVDEDTTSDDPMGVCELNYQDLVAALEAQRVHQVKVAEQTNNQILFVGISVLPP